MHKLQWTPKSYEDLDEIKRYIELDDPEAAVQMLLTIIDRVEQLQQFPESGPLMRERRFYNDRMRTLTVEPYIVFYRIDGDFVSVIRVLHAARDYGNLIH